MMTHHPLFFLSSCNLWYFLEGGKLEENPQKRDNKRWQLNPHVTPHGQELNIDHWHGSWTALSSLHLYNLGRVLPSTMVDKKKKLL